MTSKTFGDLFLQTLIDVPLAECKTSLEMEGKMPDSKLNSILSGTQPMPHRAPCQGQPAFNGEHATRVGEALGPMPRAVLTAMVDYGLSDAEMSRYFRLSTDMITSSRQFYGIVNDRKSG